MKTPLSLCRYLAPITAMLVLPLITSVAQTNCVAPAAGLVSWWTAEGSANDSIGNLHGTLYGGTTFAPGKVGQAFSFDGINDSVTNSMSGLTNILDSYTMELWAWPTAGRASTPESTSGTDGHGNQRYAIFPYPGPTGGTVGSGISVGTNGVSVFEAGDTYLPALLVFDAPIIGWTHVAVVYSNRRPSLYLNGVLVRSGLTSLNPSCPSTWLGERGAASANQGYYAGLLDEVSIYNRSLSAAEIQAIYNAGNLGKCTTPVLPFIVSQPTNQIVSVGSTATFSVAAGGTSPLSYQWRFNGANLNGATASSLVRTNLQLGDAGNYAVVVSNRVGTATSSNAVLTIHGVAPAPLWNVDFAAFGRVKVGFAAAGQANTDFWNDYTFPFEAFAGLSNLKRADGGSTTVGLTLQNGAGQTLVAHPDLMYQVACYAQDFGDITLTVTNLPAGEHDFYLYGHAGANAANTVFQLRVGGNDFGNQSTATDSSWSLTTWVEGAQYVVYRGVTVTNGGAPVIVKCHPGVSGYTYLNGLQIMAAGSTPPVIASQPASQSVLVGADATFSVTAGGTAPLSYHWRFNGANLNGATASSLILTNVQLSSAGNYSVVISNGVGSVTSSNALLTVLLPPATIQVLGTKAMAGSTIEVPVVLVANGNENALSFSLGFSTQRLAFTEITLGGGAPGAALLSNTTQAGSGTVGIAVALEAGLTFAAGTKEVVRVVFTTSILGGNQPSDTPITITNQPINKLLANPNAQPLPATYLNGLVTLSPTGLEGDASPRIDGNQALDIFDWVQVGRFVAGLDTISNANEFQRVDCAPRSTLGDGKLKVTDWVQAGRYATGLDPVTFIGGPAAPVLPRPATHGPSPQDGEGPRLVRIANGEVVNGLTVTLPVVLQSRGNENGLGFSLNFDPSALHYAGAVKGSAASSATLHANAAQASAGKVGLVLALPMGSSFVAGTQEIVRVTFIAQASVAGKYPVVLGDQPVWRAVSDSTALELTTVYVNNEIAVHGSPALAISQSGTNVILSWPSWAGDFTLQTADATPGSPINWSNMAFAAQTNGATVSVTSPASALTMFFRLFHP